MLIGSGECSLRLEIIRLIHQDWNSKLCYGLQMIVKQCVHVIIHGYLMATYLYILNWNFTIPFTSQMFLFMVFILMAAALGLAWSYYHFEQLKKIPIGGSFAIDQEINTLNSQSSLGVVQIGAIIHDAAIEFIIDQYKVCSIFILFMAAIIFVCVDVHGCYTTFAFLLGAVTSMLCGSFGMKVATFSNYRTTICAKTSLGYAFKTAFRSGVIIGFTLVSTALIILVCLIQAYKYFLGLENVSKQQNYFEFMFESIAGFGLGGSTVAMFARVGGGIFTKAADLGSDLIGKIESRLPEDSPRNPATIADNVGDNVGDIAGMGADLFGSFAESTCAALVIGGNSLTDLQGHIRIEALIFVLVIPALGIVVSLAISSLITEGEEISEASQVQKSLKKQLIYSTIGLLPFLYISTKYFLGQFKFQSNSNVFELKEANDAFLCIALGLLAGLAIGLYTQLMTSYSYKPVQQLAQSCKTGAATNIIYGLALGYLSTIIPVSILCVVCYFSHSTLGYYGVALAAMGMLSNLPICLAIDSYGPISDNAGGIAEMAELHYTVRERTDILDSAGNTTAAIGKGFAIGSATLVGFALYGAFMHSTFKIGALKRQEISFDDPLIFTCLLFGAMIPYAFSALTMKAVGKAALGLILQVRNQIRQNPGILDGTSPPDYKHCVKMSAMASLKEMIMPSLLVTVTPFVLGFVFGPKALLGFLPGAIVSAVQMAISASNTGGAWDNAKKYIEAGLMKEQVDGVLTTVRKGSQIHKSAVIGDSVGDPLKDTSGPSLNILIKLMAILSLVFCRYFSL